VLWSPRVKPRPKKLVRALALKPNITGIYIPRIQQRCRRLINFRNNNYNTQNRISAAFNSLVLMLCTTDLNMNMLQIAEQLISTLSENTVKTGRYDQDAGPIQSVVVLFRHSYHRPISFGAPANCNENETTLLTNCV